jgi:hypothetical protein
MNHCLKVMLPEMQGKRGQTAMLERCATVGVPDKGGRRMGEDRRKVSIPGFYPDGRSGQDRRADQDRRSTSDMGNVSYLKRNSDRYMEFANTQKGVLWAFLLSVPLWALIIFIFFMRSTPKF